MNTRLPICLAAFAFVLFSGAAQAELAEVPLTGRWENLAFTPAEVHRISRDRYRETIADYAAHHRLEDSSSIGRRVAAISARLIAEAGTIKPAARHWAWEVHTTSDPQVDAYCMAGGKLLVSSAFVKRLNLNDGELAMLIAHEIAHAVAEHHREELFEARRLDGRPGLTAEVVMAQLDADLSMQLRLESLSNRQETEADQLGMFMANRAGWSSRDMVGFYRKLALTAGGSLFADAYPSMSSRLSMAQGMARLFDTGARAGGG